MADISKIKLPNDNNTYNLADLVARGRIWQGPQAQYDALVQAGTIDPDTVYFVTDGTTIACSADEVSYNHTISGLSASDVKGALDELADEKMDKANPTGTGSLSLNRKAETTVGSNSATLGLGCTASANQTFAAGYNNEASGVTACAVNSTNKASGAGSFCSGYGNIAQRQFNHVFGMYNQADTGGTDEGTKGNYIEIVGKGTNQNSRSNARTLDWQGNEVLAGGLKINGNKDVMPGVCSGTAVGIAVWSNTTGSANIAITTNTGKQFVITINNSGTISGSVINP